MSVYWVVAAPNEAAAMGGSSSSRIISKLDREMRACSASRLPLPTFRVGTLDSLMVVSDQLAKDDKSIEAAVDRLLRQVRELADNPSARPPIDGTASVESYVKLFEWDEARFASSDPIDEIRAAVVGQVARVEEDLKVRLADFTQVRQARSAIERRSQGNLMARALSSVVRAEDVTETEHMTTAFVVVPRYNEPDFTQSYETLGALVVPRSARRIAEDTDYVLYGVTVFKKGMDEFRSACREKRFTVRDFVFDPGAASRDAQDLSKLVEESDVQASSFRSWSETAFSEVFIALVHIKIQRVFVESVLRYGLPVNFGASLLLPVPRQESRLRKGLIELFGHLGGSWAMGSSDSDATVVPGLTSDKDFFPYVYLELPVP